MHKALLADERYASASLGGQDIFAGKVRGHLWHSGKADAPKILVLPGFTEYCEKYAHIVTLIHEKGYDSLVIDWPGQGLSGHFGHDKIAVHIDDFDDHIKALHALLIQADWQDAEFHILGHSMGGHLALRAADHFKAQVQSVALSAPMMVPAQKPLWAIRALAKLFIKMGFGRAHVPFTKIPTIESLQSFWENNPLTTDEAGFAWQTRWFFDKLELRRFGATNGWAGAAYGSAVRTTLNPNFLRAIKQPVLIMAAEDETIVDAKAIERAAKIIPLSQYHLIANARHELFNERQEVYQYLWSLLDGFWAEHIS